MSPEAKRQAAQNLHNARAALASDRRALARLFVEAGALSPETAVSLGAIGRELSTATAARLCAAAWLATADGLRYWATTPGRRGVRSKRGGQGRAWSAADDATIRRVARAGGSAAEAARELGVTRNMVCGRAYRLDVHFRASAARRSEAGKESARRRWDARREARA